MDIIRGVLQGDLVCLFINDSGQKVIQFVMEQNWDVSVNTDGMREKMNNW